MVRRTFSAPVRRLAMERSARAICERDGGDDAYADATLTLHWPVAETKLNETNVVQKSTNEKQGETRGKLSAQKKATTYQSR